MVPRNGLHGMQRMTTAAEQIRKRLAVIRGDDFSHFVRNATEVVARIGLDYETKTVRGGALFYEEYLPPETLFCAIVVLRQSSCCSANAAQVMSWMKPTYRMCCRSAAVKPVARVCGVNLVVGGQGTDNAGNNTKHRPAASCPRMEGRRGCGVVLSTKDMPARPSVCRFASRSPASAPRSPSSMPSQVMARLVVPAEGPLRLAG